MLSHCFHCRWSIASAAVTAPVTLLPLLPLLNLKCLPVCRLPVYLFSQCLHYDHLCVPKKKINRAVIIYLFSHSLIVLSTQPLSGLTRTQASLYPTANQHLSFGWGSLQENENDAAAVGTIVNLIIDSKKWNDKKVQFRLNSPCVRRRRKMEEAKGVHCHF